MENLDVLWTTDPGWAVIGLIILAFIVFIAAYMMKFHVAPVIIDIALWVLVVLGLLGVLGIVGLPGALDYFSPPILPIV